jgi:hypothetical protein
MESSLSLKQEVHALPKTHAVLIFIPFQGSVLGPTLLLIYANETPDRLDVQFLFFVAGAAVLAQNSIIVLILLQRDRWT